MLAFLGAMVLNMIRKKKRKRKKRRVKEPLTDELLKELLASPSAEAFAQDHRFKNRTTAEYLNQLLEEHGLDRADVIRDSFLNYTFAYQIFVGTRQAKRDKLLQIAFAMHLSYLETNRLLEISEVNGLYCKNRRDAIIVFCLDHGSSLQEVNEELYRFGEDTIC